MFGLTATDIMGCIVIAIVIALLFNWGVRVVARNVMKDALQKKWEELRNCDHNDIYTEGYEKGELLTKEELDNKLIEWEQYVRDGCFDRATTAASLVAITRKINDAQIVGRGWRS